MPVAMAIILFMLGVGIAEYDPNGNQVVFFSGAAVAVIGLGVLGWRFYKQQRQ